MTMVIGIQLSKSWSVKNIEIESNMFAHCECRTIQSQHTTKSVSRMYKQSNAFAIEMESSTINIDKWWLVGGFNPSEKY